MKHAIQDVQSENPIIVSCPARLQKRMQRNLLRSACGSLSRERARKAMEILTSINPKKDNTQPQPDTCQASSQKSPETDNSIEPSAQRNTLRLRDRAAGLCKWCFKRIVTFNRLRRYQ